MYDIDSFEPLARTWALPKGNPECKVCFRIKTFLNCPSMMRYSIALRSSSHFNITIGKESGGKTIYYFSRTTPSPAPPV